MISINKNFLGIIFMTLGMFCLSVNDVLVKGLNTSVDNLMVINMLGQTVNEFKDVAAQTLDNGLSISGLASGTYVVYFNTENTTKTKKIIID